MSSITDTETIINLDGHPYVISIADALNVTSSLPDFPSTIIVQGGAGSAVLDLHGISTPGALINLLREYADIQADHANERRQQLVQLLMGTSIDPVPAAAITQAHRLARHRNQLLRSGAYTTVALAEVRGDDPASSTTRTWLTRQRQQHRLFTVRHNNNMILPAFQLGPDFEPRPQLVDILQALEPAHLGGWETWTWFTSTTSWLSGARPTDLLDTEPARVATAAQRFASNAVLPASA
jgi:hypothetical protein